MNNSIDETVRQTILTHLDQTESAIGVVASPSFEAFEHLESALLFISVELNALIFNGEEMLDSTGHPLS
jgi:hypothetical protein